MAAQIKLTTTGTLGTVTITDLNGVKFTHPIVDFDLLTNYTLLAITKSIDLPAAVTGGYVTLRDELNVNIPAGDIATISDHHITLTGDVTGSGSGSFNAAISANVVGNTKLADVNTGTLKGRLTAGTGDPEDLTVVQVTSMLNVFTPTLNGLTPLSGGGTANFLRADGTWTVPAGNAAQLTVQDEGSSLTTNASKMNFVGGIVIATAPVANEILVTLPSYGASVGTVCEGNDSRLSDDRTASGLRTASGIVSVSAATAPGVGDLLTATSATTAVWQPQGSFPGSVKQTAFTQVVADTTTVSTSFTDLLSITLTGVLVNNRVAMFATISCSNTNANETAHIRLLVDGVSAGGAMTELKTAGTAAGTAITVRTGPLTAGSHTFKLQWRTVGNTLRVRPLTNVDNEHAGLLLQEIAT